MKDFSSNLINVNSTIQDALIRLNSLSGSQSIVLFVLNNEEKLVGTITDGDIRRALLNGKKLSDPLDAAMYQNFRYLKSGEYNLNKLSEFKQNQIDIIPVLDQSGKIVKVISFREIKSLIPVDAVIMAGGKGERLRPLTEKVPKPLLKVGEKPIIEHNIDRLVKFGINKIHISVNYLGQQIKDVIGDGKEKEVQISYVNETSPLGTIGSIKLISDFGQDAVLVMNSDLLTNIDFEDFFRRFENDNAVMSVASIPYNVSVPYAVMEVENDRILSIKEKPVYTYFSNGGIYLIRKKALDLIPVNEVFHATDLLELLLARGEKVTSYPILGYWLDIGRLEDYYKAQEDIKHIKF